MKAKDLDHVTGKYWESADQECNLNLSLSKKIPVVFHNLQNCDSDLIHQEIGKYSFKINFIPKAIKNISFTVQQPKENGNMPDFC